MSEYVKIIKQEEFQELSVYFYITDERILAIGDKINGINEDAYMNGYSWDSFLSFYLERNYPDLLKDMESDPEGDSYLAVYPLNRENEIRAQKFVKVIQDLIENEAEIYELVEKYGDEIEWEG